MALCFLRSLFSRTRGVIPVALCFFCALSPHPGVPFIVDLLFCLWSFFFIRAEGLSAVGSIPTALVVFSLFFFALLVRMGVCLLISSLLVLVFASYLQ
ncbi:MAG: hypothetical protein Q4E76_06535 [Tissierellia bacterium]|nr:hypothetical protein [Tissierellia bacterium]